MNIFVLDLDVKKCAEYHCDKHVVKMITESAQVLSTNLRLKNGEEKTLWIEGKKSSRLKTIKILPEEKSKIRISKSGIEYLLNKDLKAYMSTHENHPCTKWSRESLANWKWLRDLTYYLNEEYKKRYSKDTNHKGWEVAKNLLEPNISDVGLTKFVKAMPSKFNNGDVVNSYRNYYKEDKEYMATWKIKKPYWWK